LEADHGDVICTLLKSC